MAADQDLARRAAAAGSDPRARVQADRLPAARAGAAKTGPDKTGADKTEVDKKGANRTGAERMGAERMSGEKAGGDKPGNPAAGRNLLFLREEELRLAQDLLFFGYRDFTAGADAILAELGMGRAHHRVLHFVGRRPGITVGDLLAILAITKQSLGRVLQPMIEEGYVVQIAGAADRRHRLLTLTERGQALERRLFDRQRETVMAAYREAGPAAVEGFRRVMRGMMGAEARGLLRSIEEEPVARGRAP